MLTSFIRLEQSQFRQGQEKKNSFDKLHLMRIPVKSIKRKHSSEAYSLEISLSIVAHDVTKHLQSRLHISFSSSRYKLAKTSLGSIDTVNCTQWS